jgi:hypothetical protein
MTNSQTSSKERMSKDKKREMNQPQRTKSEKGKGVSFEQNYDKNKQFIKAGLHRLLDRQ